MVNPFHQCHVRVSLLIILLGLLVFSGSSAQEAIVIAPMAGVTFSVNTTNDTIDANIGDNICADSSGNCSLRAAVHQANNTAGVDTITIPAGTYLITRADSSTISDENLNQIGDLDILESVIINGAGTSSTFLNADKKARNFFDVGPDRTGVEVTITGIQIEGSFDGRSIDTGSAIHTRTSNSLTLSDSVIRGNEPYGLYNEGTVILNNVSVASNARTGIHNRYGTLTLNRVTVSDNLHSGIYSFYGELQISESIIVRNRNSDLNGAGGGIYFLGLTANPMSIQKSTIANNTASSGGGIYLQANNNNTSAIHSIKDSTISGNTASHSGGGIFHACGKLSLENTTISGNNADQDGGGLYNTSSCGHITNNNVTITNNSAAQGGGIFIEAFTNGMALSNSLIAGNTATTLGIDCLNTANGITSNEHNLVGNAGSCAGFTATGDQVGVNPLLQPLAANGGATCTHAIASNSPAKDNGNPATATATDQRGASVVGTRDIGAFEFGATIAGNSVECDYGNTAPKANPDNYVVTSGETLAVTVTNGVLSNDTDVDDDPLTAILKANVANGVLTLNSDGVFTYTPATGFIGTDQFTYAAFDSKSESESATVTITVTEQPGSAPPEVPQKITIAPNQGRPTITWDYDVNAEWFQIWIGNLAGTAHFEWYPAKASEAFVSNQAPISCNGVTCSVTPNINPLAGSYDVWMQSWGYGNFATGGPISEAPSWNGPAKFTLSNTPPGPVNGLTTSLTGTNSSSVIFGWQGAERATWYNVWVGTDGTGTPPWTPQFFDWMLAEDLGCENAGPCTLSAGVKTATGTANLSLPVGEYIWYVQSWGPGGFSTGGSFDPPLDSWVEANKFTVP